MTVTTKSSLLQGRSCKISRSTMKSRLASITWWSGHPSRKGCSIVSLTPSLICQKHTAKVNIYQHFYFFFHIELQVLQFYTKAILLFDSSSLLAKVSYQVFVIHIHFSNVNFQRLCTCFFGISVQSFIREWFILLILCHPKKMSLLHRLHPFKRVNFQIL